MFQLDDDLVRAVKLTSRERRFIKFASVEYDGQLYMTPQDFLESVVEQEPRRKLHVPRPLMRSAEFACTAIANDACSPRKNLAVSITHGIDPRFQTDCI